MSDKVLSGKVALVTGAGTGIGRGIAVELARQGADVVVHYGQSSEPAEQVAADIRVMGRRSVALQADFSDLDAVEALAGAASTALGPIDILINNAGITFNVPFLDMRRRHLAQLYTVNVLAGFLLTQKLAGSMVERGGGAVVNLTSVHGLQGAAEHAGYAGTKGAISAQTRAIAIELAPHGVRVNAIAPGWIDVENHALADPGYDAAASARRAAQTIPAGRHGYPGDVGSLAAFLCSDAASFIIGQTFVIDGGTTALMSLFADFRAKSDTRFGVRYMK